MKYYEWNKRLDVLIIVSEGGSLVGVPGNHDLVIFEHTFQKKIARAFSMAYRRLDIS